MKAKELRQKTKQELELMLKENQDKLRQLRFDLAAKKFKKTHQLKETKKLIARLLTVLNSSHDKKDF